MSSSDLPLSEPDSTTIHRHVHESVDDELEKAFNEFWVEHFVTNATHTDDDPPACFEKVAKCFDIFFDRFIQASNSQQDGQADASDRRLRRMGEMASAMSSLRHSQNVDAAVTAIRESYEKSNKRTMSQQAQMDKLFKMWQTVYVSLNRISNVIEVQEVMLQGLNSANSNSETMSVSTPTSSFDLVDAPETDLIPTENFKGKRNVREIVDTSAETTASSQHQNKPKHRSSGGLSDSKNRHVSRESSGRSGPFTSISAAKLENEDLFAFDATIIYVHKRSDTTFKIPCRGKMDTGSQDNWVSRRIIASTHLEYTIETLPEPKAYRAFGGDVFFPIGQVKIQWYLQSDSHRSLTSLFLVGDEVPFDMVVGSTLIQQEDLLARKEAALGVRVVEPTEDELANMELEALSGARSRQQLAAIQTARKSRAKAQRELARRQAVTATDQSSSTAVPSLASTTTSGQATQQSS